MAQNYPGPYSVEIQYQVDGVIHRQELNCSVEGTVSVGDAPSTINLTTKGTTPVQLDTAVSAWVALIAELFNTAVDFQSYILWKYEPLSTTRTFITSQTISQAGLSANPTTPAHQVTLTFRTQEGGTMRIVLLETVQTTKVRNPASGYTPSGQVGSIFAFVESPDNWIVARDTSFPIASMNLTGGENERVFKKRYRT